MLLAAVDKGNAGRSRKATGPGAYGVVELSPREFLDRRADFVPSPRKHRHRYHGVFVPNHDLRRAVTAITFENVAKRGEEAIGGHGGDGNAEQPAVRTRANTPANALLP